MTWKELSKIALLGTEHSTFPEEVMRDLRTRGIDVGQEAPVVLAEAVALFSQMKKAGFPLKDFEGELPEAAKSQNEKYCSRRSTHHFQLILSGEYEAVLPEFLRHLEASGICLTTGHLPELMARNEVSELWPAIEPVLGSRGRWLLAQHPDWQKWLPEVADFDWYTGGKEERLSWFRHLRRTTPEQALDLLRTIWTEEDYRWKVSFLEALGTGLSMRDELFLEACLDEGRKEVRQVAANLLARLPESRLSKRMYLRAEAFFTFKKNELHVNIPGEMDRAALRDGILKNHPGWPGGRKAGYLGQVVAVVPPDRWVQFFDKKLSEVLEIFTGTNWADTLLRAVLQATVLHEDAAWAEAMFGWYVRYPELPLWHQPEMTQLARIVQSPVINSMALVMVKNEPIPDALPRILPFLMTTTHAMTDDLTHLLIQRFREWLANNTRRIWDPPPFKDMLTIIGLHCNPGLYDTLQKDWDNRATLWDFYEKHVGKMLNTVLFRREMIEAMTKEAQ